VTTGQYVIRGGVAGRERLRLLARVLLPTTQNLLERAGIDSGMNCLDVGCGGGDVSFELARRVGPGGRVVGLDRDEIKLGLARDEARSLALMNVAFHASEIAAFEAELEFDIVYARFLLTHLPSPAEAIARMQTWLRPGGMLVVEDIDFSGHFCHPESPPFRRYLELYIQAARRRGGDPHIGPRLPALLHDAGFSNVSMHVVQPAGFEGEVKLVHPLTMENIAQSVVEDGLASQAEVDQIIADLYEFAHSPRTVASLPRIVQTWGRCPA